ncbi:MAG: flagellar biosynthetic protein FliQ [Methylobacter sp.]|nr:MAG: flagellar biosynthetic protein FliQ [Methylobacter sp.]PPD19592.1 MAG: flagellar biosynthetic protein FliQ [Methylobacter sp.]
MTPETIYDLGQQALIITAKLALPILVPSLLIGLVIAVFQAATQINESTLTFVPKVVVIIVVLIVAGPWMLQVFLDYFQDLVHDIPHLVG